MLGISAIESLQTSENHLTKRKAVGARFYFATLHFTPFKRHFSWLVTLGVRNQRKVMSKHLYKVIFISTFLVSVLSSCIVNDEEELTNIEYTITSSGTQADIQSQKHEIIIAFIGQP